MSELVPGGEFTALVVVNSTGQGPWGSYADARAFC
jgi:hypothetical protein